MKLRMITFFDALILCCIDCYCKNDSLYQKNIEKFKELPFRVNGMQLMYHILLVYWKFRRRKLRGKLRSKQCEIRRRKLRQKLW